LNFQLMNTCFHPYCKNPNPQFQSKLILRLDETKQEEDKTTRNETTRRKTKNQYILVGTRWRKKKLETCFDGDKKIDPDEEEDWKKRSSDLLFFSSLLLYYFIFIINNILIIT
jgi:hypothetical protein